MKYRIYLIQNTNTANTPYVYGLIQAVFRDYDTMEEAQQYLETEVIKGGDYTILPIYKK